MLEGCTPWPEEFVKLYREKGYWVDQTLGDVLDESAERFALQEAIVGDNGTRYTYQQLKQLSDRLALHFLELGLKPQDRVLMQLNNVPEFPIVFFGLVKAGLIPVACIPQYRLHEMGYFGQVTQATAYVVPSRIGDYAYTELARQVQQQAPGIRQILVHGDDVPAGCISIMDLLVDPIEERVPFSRLAEVRPDATEVALLLLSGGTTGVPKLIPRTHNDAIVMSRGHVQICPEFAGTIVCFTPVAHTMGLLGNLQPTIMAGGKFILSMTPDTAHIFEIIERERVTQISTGATPLVRMLGHPSLGRHDFGSLKAVVCGGQKTHADLKAKAEVAFKVNVQEMYAMGEGFTCGSHTNAPRELRHQTVGHPVSPGDELRLVDEEGRDVPPGEVGEIIGRGPGVIRGYYKAPEHNMAAFDGEGFYHTGDLGRIGPLGGLQIVGRRKDMINRGGEHISAEELDALILAHPAVANVAVVGMPDEEMGEKACAYVILKPGEKLTLPELCSYMLAKDIAKFKLPERLEVVEEFRIIGLGKVDKKVLREDIAAKLRQA